MNGKHLRRATAVPVLLGLFLVTLFTFTNISQGTAAEPANLKVSLLPYISYAPIFIAAEEGYFAEQGLKIEFVKIRGAGQSIPALVSGGLDVSTDTTGSNLFTAVASGLKIKIVADKGHLDVGCNYVAIMVRKDLYDSGEVRTLAQLKGRKVVLSSIPIWGYVYEKILSKGNLTLDDIGIVRMSVSARVGALEKKAIDVFIAGEPMITQLETLGYAVRLARYEDFVPDYQVASIIFGPNLLEKNPELGKKFMIAYLRGVRQYNKGKTDRNIEIFQKHTGLDADILKRICLPSIYPDGHVNTKSIFAFQDWAYKKGFIDSKVTADQLIDMSFAEYANKVLEKTYRN